MAQEKPSWVESFMYLALGASMRSKDPRTRVGCVIVDSQTLKILSTGYNGFPQGINNSNKNWEKDQKTDLVVHAEANAVLLKGRASLENAIAFVTLFPCEDCAKLLIQAGVSKVYYLSFRETDNFRKSAKILRAANVALVPFYRGNDEKLETFQDRLITLLRAARQNVTDKAEANPNKKLYEQLKVKKKELRENDIESPWPRDVEAEQRSDEVLFKKWNDYFLFLALVASTRSSKEIDREGAILIDKGAFKHIYHESLARKCGNQFLCHDVKKGYPRSVEETHDDAMMVSAIGNVLALRFCEGNKFHAFCTDFPKEGEVKNLAQAKVERLYFISPKHLTEKALSILEAAGVEAVPMNLLNEEEMEKEIKNTIKGLVDREDITTSSFKKWPNTHWTPYELKPKRRGSGLEGVTTTSMIGIGLIGIAVGVCVGIRIAQRGALHFPKIVV